MSNTEVIYSVTVKNIRRKSCSDFGYVSERKVIQILRSLRKGCRTLVKAETREDFMSLKFLLDLYVEMSRKYCIYKFVI